MAEPTIQLGGGNWAGKSGNLLGYYEQNKKFYAEDFTFSRSTTGTYTDSDGYIQEMPYNLLQQSNQFDTTWLNQLSGTIVGGQNGYDGTNNAWKLSKSAATFKSVRQVISTSGIQTLSAYLKADTLDKASFRIDTTSVIFIDFDLTNGTYSISGGSPTSANIQEVSNGWYRADVTFNESITNVHIYVDKSNATSGSIFVQNAQLVKGTSAKTYFPTTTRLNMPRVDYLNNSNGSLILEPQRTNAINYSNDYTLWSNTQFTINGNSVTSPEGITNGTKIVPSTSNTEKYLDKGGLSRTSGEYITHTVYAKASGYNFLYLSNAASRLYAVYDLQQGLVIYNNSNGTDFNNHSASIELFGNGWYRCKLIGQAQSSGASYFRISCGITAINSSTSGLFQGDGTSGVEVYGSQVELNASYETSYIPTSGSTVTRTADVCNNAGTSATFNSTEGVLFAEIAALTEDGDGTTRLSISDGSQDNNITIGYSATNTLRTIIRSGASNQALMTSSQTITNYLKVAVKYKVNDFALWVNGVEVATDTSGLAPVGLSELSFDRGDAALPFYGKVKDLKVYNTALSDTELATLTTL